MAKRTLLEISFPLAGLDRSVAYQRQAPYTTPDAQNVCPDGTIKSRMRGGSRPGLGKAYYEELGSGAKIRLLTSITTVGDDGFRVWEDPFLGTELNSVWSTASWIGTPAPILVDGFLADIGPVGVTRAPFDDWDASKTYELAVFIAPWNGAHHGLYQIFGRMDNTTPVATTAGFVAELAMQGTGGVFAGSLRVYVAGTPTTYTFTSGNDGAPQSGWFRVVVAGNNVKCYWRDNALLDQNISAAAGSSFGFGINCTNEPGACLVDSFRVQYGTGIADRLRTRLIASAGGTLYRESFYGSLEAVSSSLTLASDRLLQAAERGQKLYIADHGDVVASGTDGAIGGGGSNQLTSASGGNFATAGVDADDMVLELTGGVDAQYIGAHTITNVSGTTLTFSPALGSAAAGVTFRIARGLKVYDPLANTLSILTAETDKGSVPVACPLICRYRDRLVVGGPIDSPNMWFMSRQGNPRDWDYSEQDAGAAVAGSTGEAGLVGERLTALIPGSDDYLLLGCVDSLWKMVGDPTYQGQIVCLSQRIGVISKKAWCYGPNGEVVFLSHDGLYRLPPGADAFPEPLSRPRLPEELLGIDPSLCTVSLEYDVHYQRVHIYLSNESGDNTRHWFFDWQTEGFWPQTVPTDMDPMATHYYEAELRANAGLIVGCRDGYIRRYHDRFETDEGTLIDSYVLIGPFPLGSGYTEGKLAELIGILAQRSGNVRWDVRVAKTPEMAVVANNRESGVFQHGDDDGLNYTAYPMAGGGACVVKLSRYEDNRAWAIEGLQAVVVKQGKNRK